MSGQWVSRPACDALHASPRVGFTASVGVMVDMHGIVSDFVLDVCMRHLLCLVIQRGRYREGKTEGQIKRQTDVSTQTEADRQTERGLPIVTLYNCT